MGYIFLFTALLAGSAKGFAGKKISGIITTPKQSVLSNFMRMIICIVISVAVLLLETKGQSLMPDRGAILVGILSGITLSAFTVTWMLAIRHGAFMLISVAQTFGMIVTLACSFVVFREPVTARQYAGIVILVIAVLIMASYSNKIVGALTPYGITMLVLYGVSCGLYDFSGKLFTSFSDSPISTFNLITYFVSALFLGAVFLLPSKGEKINAAEFVRKTIIAVFFMSVCLFVNSYFMTLTTKHLPPAQLYPLSRAGGMILASVMSSVFFKERITARCVVGLCLSFVALLLLK
ncbi:MAG: DMT family transporter [Clostridia bacterium]|nr:DMT family transporter [Clostridia bacterium]